MPRPLGEYTAWQWLRLRPLVDRRDHARYLAQVEAELAKPARRGDPDALRAAMAGRRVLVTIAFNDADLIGWQAALVRRHVDDCFHLVADNSLDESASERIERRAAAFECGYVRLPGGPWRTAAQASRSHGLAMSWVWRHLVRPARPTAFGFIDHDLFPMQPTDPFAPLARAVVAGQVRNRSGRERWYLWAGFCFFRFEAADRAGLDFSLDWSAGLDTGGGVWFTLYRALGPSDVHDCGLRAEPVSPTTPIELSRFEWIGPWLHESNFRTPLALPAAERQALLAERREALRGRIRDALG